MTKHPTPGQQAQPKVKSCLLGPAHSIKTEKKVTASWLPHCFCLSHGATNVLEWLHPSCCHTGWESSYGLEAAVAFSSLDRTYRTVLLDFSGCIEERSCHGRQTQDNHPAENCTQLATNAPGEPVLYLSVPFIPLSTGSHPYNVLLCLAARDPSAHAGPFSPPHALMSFNITDFCMVSVYNWYLIYSGITFREVRSTWLSVILQWNKVVSPEVAFDSKAPYSPIPYFSRDSLYGCQTRSCNSHKHPLYYFHCSLV